MKSVTSPHLIDVHCCDLGCGRVLLVLGSVALTQHLDLRGGEGGAAEGEGYILA